MRRSRPRDFHLNESAFLHFPGAQLPQLGRRARDPDIERTKVNRLIKGLVETANRGERLLYINCQLVALFCKNRKQSYTGRLQSVPSLVYALTGIN